MLFRHALWITSVSGTLSCNFTFRIFLRQIIWKWFSIFKSLLNTVHVSGHCTDGSYYAMLRLNLMVHPRLGERGSCVRYAFRFGELPFRMSEKPKAPVVPCSMFHVPCWFKCCALHSWVFKGDSVSPSSPHSHNNDMMMMIMLIRMLRLMTH